MNELHRFDPTGRFTGLAELYARCRPDYPEAAFDHIQEHCGLQPGDLVIDVGCGTGISARLLAARGLRVIGIEPNEDMRRQAEAATLTAGLIAPEYRDATAEATGLPDEVADAVLSAQAFHWFDAPRALTEFARLLKPAGWTVLIWNERDEGDPFAGAYGKIVRSFTRATQMESARRTAGQAFLGSTLFTGQTVTVFAHRQVMTEEEMIGRALSVSYAPRDSAEIERVRTLLGEVFRRFQTHGRVVLQYRTSVYLGRKK